MPKEDSKPLNDVNITSNITYHGSLEPIEIYHSIEVDGDEIRVLEHKWNAKKSTYSDRELFQIRYYEIADLISRIDAAEEEIGRLWSALQGKLEVEENG